MVKAANKIKTAGANYPIPCDRDEADVFIFKIGALMRDRALIQTALDDNLAALKAEYEDKALPIAFALAQHIKGLQTWCETNRAELLDADLKTVRFGNGEVSWRSRPASVTLRRVEKIIEWCRTSRRLRSLFLRVKTEINKEAMLAHPDLATKIPGVTIASAGEDFIVTPLEAPLEKIA